MWLQVSEQVTHNKNCVSWCWYNYVTGPAKKHNIQVKIYEWKSSIIDKQVKCYLYVCMFHTVYVIWMVTTASSTSKQCSSSFDPRFHT